MKNIIGFVFSITLLINCTPPSTSSTAILPSETLVQLFPVAHDSITTFHFYNSDEEIINPIADSIITSAISEDILEKIEYGTGDAMHQINQQFPLDEKYLGCIMDGTESWFRNQALLLYNQETKSFEDAIILSQFYGGDGGQIVTESWIYTENKKKFLYQKESSHAIIPSTDSDELVEMLDEHSQLYVWNGNIFKETIQQDSINLDKQFQMKWEW